MVQSTIDIVSHAASIYYDTDWGTDVGAIELVLSNIVMWHNWTGIEDYKPNSYVNSEASSSLNDCPHNEIDLYNSSKLYHNNYCEVDYDDYLNKFNAWRISSGLAPQHDNGHLFSYYDFYSSVIGYASLPGMCINSKSGGIEQCVFSDTYNGVILARMYMYIRIIRQRANSV